MSNSNEHSFIIKRSNKIADKTFFLGFTLTYKQHWRKTVTKNIEETWKQLSTTLQTSQPLQRRAFALGIQFTTEEKSFIKKLCSHLKFVTIITECCFCSPFTFHLLSFPIKSVNANEFFVFFFQFFFVFRFSIKTSLSSYSLHLALRANGHRFNENLQP
jgi:hypothetical protein